MAAGLISPPRRADPLRKVRVHWWTLPGLLSLASHDGAGAWAELVASARRALTSNQAIAPIVGLVVLAVIVVVADWKLAGWLERTWRGRTRSRRGGGGRPGASQGG